MLLSMTSELLPGSAADHATSDSPLYRDPCAAARCQLPRSTFVTLRLGGQLTDVPVCTQHASAWQRSTGG